MTKDLVCVSLQRGFRLHNTAQEREWYCEDDLDALRLRNVGSCRRSHGDHFTLLSYFDFLVIFTLFSLPICNDRS